MKKINLIVLMLILLSGLFSCHNKNKKAEIVNITNACPEMDKLSWLTGKWQNLSDEGNAVEIWERTKDSAYNAISYLIKAKDTITSETILLEQKSKDIYYIPTVKGQNNAMAVKFVLTSSPPAQLVFENSKHDFPQMITYTRIGEDSLLVVISGKVNGQMRTEEFPFKKTKLSLPENK
jgi:hypothetical protein